MRAVRIFRWVQYSNVTDRCSRQSERPIFPNVCLNLGTYFLMSASERDGTGDNSAENSTLHEFFRADSIARRDASSKVSHGPHRPKLEFPPLFSGPESTYK